MTMLPPDGNLYPAVGMHSEGEEVKVMLDAEWHYEDLELMAVDDGEDDWSRLHDVKLNGTVRWCQTQQHGKVVSNSTAQ
jgi:hypothetical protein